MVMPKPVGNLKRKLPNKSSTNPDGASIPMEVVEAHFNASSSADPKLLDDVAERYLTGNTPAGLPQHVTFAADRKLKTIEAPAECPSDHEAWRQEISRLLGIAVYKMALRLAKEGDKMSLSKIPVSMAVAIDKRLLLAGQPTSFAVSVNATLTHDALLDRIRSPGAKPQPSPPSGAEQG